MAGISSTAMETQAGEAVAAGSEADSVNATLQKSSTCPKKRTIDPMHWTTVGCFAICTAFWIAALAAYHPQPWWVLQNASVALALCFVLDAIVLCMAPELPLRLVPIHFGLGVFQNILYIILFAIDPDLFAQAWTSLYFGYYLFTWIAMMTQKRQFFPMFRVFYTIHHTISFFITGSWIMVGPCCAEDNNDFIYRAIVIWLSADIWNYLLNIYRSLSSKTLDKDMIRKMQTVVFGIERVHRTTAYFQALTVTSEQHNTLMWVVLSTGLFNDVLDASFQLHSLCKHARNRKLAVELGRDAKC